jgi:protoporphyrinogen oxidase
VCGINIVFLCVRSLHVCPPPGRNKTESGWGPNAVFRFPQQGGTGAIWKKVADLLPADKQRYKSQVVSIDAAAKAVTLSDGSVIRYNKVCFSFMFSTVVCFDCLSGFYPLFAS